MFMELKAHRRDHKSPPFLNQDGVERFYRLLLRILSVTLTLRHVVWQKYTDVLKERPAAMHAGFEVLTVVVMKSVIFWDIALCSPLKVT
jgi:hypothetical protein